MQAQMDRRLTDERRVTMETEARVEKIKDQQMINVAGIAEIQKATDRVSSAGLDHDRSERRVDADFYAKKTCHALASLVNDVYTRLQRIEADERAEEQHDRNLHKQPPETNAARNKRPVTCNSARGGLFFSQIVRLALHEPAPRPPASRNEDHYFDRDQPEPESDKLRHSPRAIASITASPATSAGGKGRVALGCLAAISSTIASMA